MGRYQPRFAAWMLSRGIPEAAALPSDHRLEFILWIREALEYACALDLGVRERPTARSALKEFEVYDPSAFTFACWQLAKQPITRDEAA